MRILESVYKPSNKIHEHVVCETKAENAIKTKSLFLDEVSLRMKLKSTKRKLHNNYEQLAKGLILFIFINFFFFYFFFLDYIYNLTVAVVFYVIK